MPPAERGIQWNDRLLGIEWPISDPILSDKDLKYPPLTPTSGELPRYEGKLRTDKLTATS
jgi:dTDP-4-dehydrorhamnose 3,5-epimerase